MCNKFRLEKKFEDEMGFVKNNLKLIIILAIIIASILYFKNHQSDNQTAQAFPTQEVSVVEVNKSDVALKYEYPGKVIGYREVELRAQIGGILQKKLYKEGSIVKKDDVLFQIDPKSSENNLKRAEAQLTTAKSNLLQLEKTWKRIDELYDKKSVSAQEKDIAFANYQKGLAAVKDAEANLSNASINLNYTNVSAPISGITSEEELSEGNLVNTGDLLARITQLDPIYISFSYPDTDYDIHRKLINSKKVDTPVNGKFSAIVKLGNGQALDQLGYIDFTDSIINPETANVSARVEISNTENQLIPGQFVRIQINDMILKNAITIPEKSIIQTANGAIVYIVGEGNKVAVKPVQLGNITDKGRIIEAGLEPGEQVIVEGLIKARPGIEVKPIKI
ncbi:MAG: efflux RND transporter periplasmic adaptor subunit [Alphaproteobacteria bacterium]